MCTHPIRLAALVAAECAVLAFGMPTVAVAQPGEPLTPYRAHQLATTNATALRPLAGARLAQVAEAAECAVIGYDNAHVQLSVDEAVADAQRGSSVALVRLPLAANLPDGAHAWWIEDGTARHLAVVPPADARGSATLTVRLATQPSLEFDVDLISGTAIIVRDARLHGAGGSVNIWLQPDVVELEWRDRRSVGWTSVLIGLQPQGLTARVVASKAL